MKKKQNKRNSKYFNYRNNKHCKECNKFINDEAIRCKNCNSKTKKHLKIMLKNFELHPSKGRLTHGRFLKIYYCIDCKKEISKYAGIYGNGRCGSCAQRRKKLSKKTKIKIGKASKLNWKNKEFRKRNQTKLIKHHIYGKLNEDIIHISRKIHKTLHSQAYFYIIEHYGKKGINKYIKWFEQKFKIKLNK